MEAPFSCARSIERFSGAGRDCLRQFAACLRRSDFCLQISAVAFTCSSTTSTEYSKFCCRMAFLRGFVTLIDAENSRSAREVGLSRAIPPSLARNARRARSSSLGGGWQVSIGTSFDRITDSSD